VVASAHGYEGKAKLSNQKVAVQCEVQGIPSRLEFHVVRQGHMLGFEKLAYSTFWDVVWDGNHVYTIYIAVILFADDSAAGP
jgi:hypothetical protein